VTESLLERTLKSALLAGAGFAILAGTAVAQDPAPAAEPVATEAEAAAASASEEVTVTGSRIRKKDYTANSPLQTVTGETLREIGVATVETYLNTLPQFSPALSKSNNNPQGGGTATLDLRQLGSQRGLVLMNGRRLIPGFSGGSVDVSSLPPALIERVEIITGGASAVYGSDAISGVVNFILRDNFSGIETTAKFGTSEFGDGNEVNLSGTIGGNFEDDKGNAVLSIGYTQRDLRSAAGC
jgi:iron complex outermembrane receptor protein